MPAALGDVMRGAEMRISADLVNFSDLFVDLYGILNHKKNVSR